MLRPPRSPIRPSNSNSITLPGPPEQNERPHDDNEQVLQEPPPYEAVARARTLEDEDQRYGQFLEEGNVSSLCKGYENGMRQSYALDTEKLKKLSLYTLFKALITSDSITEIPVEYNEPLSGLQRLALDMKYSDLLDIAARLKDSAKRIVYVTAFALSKYASSTTEFSKSFNPLLGETFEFVDTKRNYRFFAEQIRHHSSSTAVCAESPNWVYSGVATPRSVGRGRSFDHHPGGPWYVKLSTPDGGVEVYSWTKPTLYVTVPWVSGAGPKIERYDSIEVKNLTTGEVGSIAGCKMSLKEEFGGKVINARGQLSYTIRGRWGGGIYASMVPDIKASEGSSLDFKDGEFTVWESDDSALGSSSPSVLPPFLAALNDLPDTLRPYLPPTDSRLRPDLRALESRQYGLAAAEKRRLEELQRIRAGHRQVSGLDYVPRWFRKEKFNDTEEWYWEFDRGYWKERGRVVVHAAEGYKWERVVKIFNDSSVE
ncbi:Oxysterol-binding protein-domain-containing protein [Xylogone sp. PMI_703]|nr:Oxysterol-binding protein-domain-containing protein [Xylogone sp. PMI_703]